MTETAGSKRSWRLHVIKVAAGLVFLLVVFSQVSAAEVSRIISSLQPGPFLLSCALLTVAVLLNAMRWHIIMKQLDHPIGADVAAVGNLEAMFFNQILPTGIGGDAIRVLRAWDVGARWGWAVVGVIMDRAFGLLAVALTVLFVVATTSIELVSQPSIRILTIAASIVAAGALAVAVAGRYVQPHWLPERARPLVSLMQSFSTCLLDPRSVGRIAIIALLSTLITGWSFAICAAALGIVLTWPQALMVVQGIALAAVIPMSIGGWGVREGAAILIFGAMGIAPAQATAVSIVFGLVLTAVGLIGAGVWYMRGYRRFGGLRRMAEIHASQKNGIEAVQ